jgi:hypothetical protein
MQTVENQTLAGATITLDDKHYVNCQLTSCRLVYSGGDFVLTETKIENCQVMLAGAAQRTAGLLAVMGALKPGGPLAQIQPQKVQ